MCLLTFIGPSIFGKRYDEHPSGDCPRLLKGVWNVACNIKIHKNVHKYMNVDDVYWD